MSLLGAPVVWFIHLAASYFFVALECGTSWDGAETAVMLATLLGAVVAAGGGVFGWREWKRAGRSEPGIPLDPPGAREFLMLSGAVLAALFVGAIVITGLSPLFLPVC